MDPWDPEQSDRYAGPHLRSARDLLDRVPLKAPLRIIDLGCGAGEGSRLLAERYPEARITAVEGSAEALAEARTLGDHNGRIAFVAADPAAWEPPGRVDMVYSSTALHRLRGHEVLFPRMLEMLAPWGVLAVQMPRHFDDPAHRCIAESVRAGPWRDRLEPLLAPVPVAPALSYSRLLAPRCRTLDIWETVYHHPFTGPDPIAEWSRVTTLRPFIDMLGHPAERDRFFADYAGRLREAYPCDGSGRTLFPFRRLFIIAQAPITTM